MVREHRPQPSQRLGRDPRAQLRNVALEVCADEVLAPAQADRVILCEEAVGETASNPQLIQLLLAHLGDVERRELDKRDSPRQALARLGQQVDRGGAQQQEPAGPGALAPALVDHPAQRLEQAGRALDLIEDHELPGMVGEVKLRLSQTSPVRRGLQVQIGRRPPVGDLQGERRLPRLPRAEQGNGRRLAQQRSDFSSYPSLDHPCNYKPLLQICTDE